ncbi:hypothetical protein EHI8A_084420 [Entamoeba histolytica HM-1:IMSS-B]|uniref:Uncharacterized protein n=6 Tax=Entamoeba histolytica TaxID=5759 RepID=C4M1M5_ENTH1|nr:hypothetical protein EHI_133960 [Entamoeba histolytica HM-1:IMSS]EMD44201.1 Hypothetical protein EHI5A_123640 [Entamoeba histolytica KU27]EMH76978.1 hypothetical protein EHI8A_084420 [Entamoeba histolytica HM-1:IMSS-B]EMS12985.1 hypothetical protein KM1_146790 [Entamoeba histolytica HM-3:IMSS]ENY64632.1 hypothetical protein EHI7A_121750 [Entamoeba histolytica HM-1:IMSS-A]GAT95129.1 hypothetical protein CL6EHI_133960 [Entamoeba histolytica]|eukprot:XP_655420.2 hypothetical protein EHI_133960 [Entamoeba histolytica HM-1:IMSS]
MPTRKIVLSRSRSENVFRMSQVRGEDKRAELTKKSLSDWLKANSLMIGQMLNSNIANKQVYEAAILTVSFMSEIKVLKEGLMLELLKNTIDKDCFIQVGELLIAAAPFMQNEEAENIFKVMSKWKGHVETLVPLLARFVSISAKIGLKYAAKERTIGVVQRWIQGCNNPKESSYWMKEIHEILKLLTPHALEDMMNEMMKELIKGEKEPLIQIKLLTSALSVRGDGTGIDRDFIGMKKVIGYLEEITIENREGPMVNAALEYIRMYIESTHLSIPAQLLLQLCIIMTDSLDMADTLFRWLNETVVKERKTPAHDVIVMLMKFIEGHISSVDSESGMICLQRVLVHYNQTVCKSIIVVDNKIEVIDKSGNGLYGIHLLWEVAMANKRLYTPIVNFMAKFFCNVPSTLCSYIVDTFTTLCTSTDTNYLVKTLILFIEKTSELIRDQPEKNIVNVYLEEVNDESWRCDKFKVNVQVINNKIDENMKDLLEEQQTTLENFERTNKLIFLTKVGIENVGRMKIVLSKKMKSLINEIRIKVPKSFDFVQSIDEEELAGRIKIICKDVELTDGKSVIGKDVIIKFGEYQPVIYSEYYEEVIKRVRCVDKNLVERLTEVIRSNNETVAFSGWQLLEALFDFIAEGSEIDTSLNGLCENKIDGSLLPSLAFVVKCLAEERESVEMTVERYFWKLLSVTCQMIQESNVESSTIRGVIIEQLCHIIWHTLIKQSEYRWCSEMQRQLNIKLLEFCKDQLLQWQQKNETNDTTHYYTYCLLHFFLYIGMMFCNYNYFNECFFKSCISAKSKEDVINIYCILDWFIENDQQKKKVIGLCEYCFSQNVSSSSINYGYYKLLSELFLRYKKNGGNSELFNSLCKSFIEQFMLFINPLINNNIQLNGLLTICISIAEVYPELFQEYNLFIKFIPFINAYLFPLTTDIETLNHFPRCKSIESRRLCYDLIIELTENEGIISSLITHISRYFSLHTRQKLLVIPPLLTGNINILFVMYQLASVFLSTFMVKIFQSTELNMKIIKEIQTVITYIQNVPEQTIDISSLELMLNEKGEECKEPFTIIKTIISILKESEYEEEIELFKGEIKTLIETIKNKTSSIIFVELSEVEEINDTMTITKIECNNKKGYEYQLFGVIGECSQFKIGNSWFSYKLGEIKKIGTVSIKKHISTIYVYKQCSKEIDHHKRVTFTFKNEVILFEEPFQKFIYTIAIQASHYLPIQTLRFIFFYFDVVYLRLPRQPLTSKWNILLHELYDKTKDDNWIIKHFDDVNVLDAYSRCRSPEIRSAIFDILHQIIEHSFSQCNEYSKSPIGNFIKTCLHCIEQSPTIMVVDLFDYFAVNSIEEMNFVITTLNIFDHIVQIIKGRGGIFLPNNCAISMLRCFYTLYVNCDIGENNKKPSTKQCVHLENDLFLNDIEFLYSITRYEVTTLFLEEFIRIVFIGHPDRTTSFLSYFIQNVDQISLSQFIFLKNLFKFNDRYNNEMAKVLIKPLKSLITKAESNQSLINNITNFILLTELSPTVYTVFKTVSKQINDKISVSHIKLVFL